jgi:large subunit ribosomal protein L6
VSRIGKLPIEIPDKVQVTLDKQQLTVKGPKGELQREINADVDVQIKDGVITVDKRKDDKAGRSLWGLTRALIANMVEGVTNGFSKKLEIVGVGYKVEMKGKTLILNLGYSHPIVMRVMDEITIETPNPNEIIVSGINKELVGVVAAKIRSFRKPEPYKGKGVKYAGEYIRRKAGKTAGK